MQKLTLILLFIVGQVMGAQGDEYDRNRADRRVDVRLDSVMTPNEMAKTGVSRLNPQERRQLEMWLSRWSIEMMNRGVEKSNVFRVTEIESKGEIVHLSDGSTYRVSPFEQQKSKNWDIDNRIEIRGEKNLLRPYRLVNLDKNTSVSAELVRSKEKKPRREFEEIRPVEEGKELIEQGMPEGESKVPEEGLEMVPEGILPSNK
jgi:hypothetical protein